MSRLLFTGGTVVTADGSFRADVLVEDEKILAVGTRHGNVDYTPYEGMSFHGGPASVYVRGNLVYQDGEVVGERGSGRFVERSFKAANVEVKV